MVQITVEDQRNSIMLTEGYLPNMEQQKAAYPHYGPFRDFNPQFESLEQSAAWTMSARMRQSMYHRAEEYGGKENVLEIPVETWIIGPPNNELGKLSDWFKRRSNSYRLIVNRTPSALKGFLAWGIHIRHRTGKFIHLKSSGYKFLEELLSAYSLGREHPYFSSVGHPYWLSRGLPEKDW